jgi:hypothetical protein
VVKTDIEKVKHQIFMNGESIFIPHQPTVEAIQMNTTQRNAHIIKSSNKWRTLLIRANVATVQMMYKA